MNSYTQPSVETVTGNYRPDRLLPSALKGIAILAKREPQRQFGGLYSLLNKTNLRAAYFGLNRSAAPGIDGVDYQTYGKNLDDNIEELTAALKGKRYHAKLVKRVYIPKDGNTCRPLGILTVSDKCAQSVAAQILSAIYEQDFVEYSYAYRANRSQRDAIKYFRTGCMENKCGWVVEADITSYFDTINHDWLMKMLEQRIKDNAFLRLIKKWLNAGILDTDKHIIHPATGTPQGGIISCVLANIYLHYALDIWFEKKLKPSLEGDAFLVRYADDFIVLFQYHRDAQKFYKELEGRLQKFNLSLSKEKTRVCLFSRFRKRESARLDFLGFEFRWGKNKHGQDCIKQRTSRKKLRNSLASFTEWCKEMRNKRLRFIFERLNQKLRGYYAYYGISGNSISLKVFYDKALRILFRRLNRRSQRRSFNWKTYTEILRYYNPLKPRTVWGKETQIKMALS